MTASEFMQRLAQELHGLSAQERDEALRYYREYFEEAGEEADAAAQALGSPQIVAQRIIAEAGRPGSTAYIPPVQQPAQQKQTANSHDDYNIVRMVLIILLVVVLVPLWLTLCILWISMVGTLICILCSFLTGVVAGAVAGVSALVGGVTGTALWSLGAALVCLGLLLLLWKPFLDLSVISFKGLRALAAWGMKAISGKEDKA